MMLGDDNENVRNVEVAKALAPRKQVAKENAINDDCRITINGRKNNPKDLRKFLNSVLPNKRTNSLHPSKLIAQDF